MSTFFSKSTVWLASVIVYTIFTLIVSSVSEWEFLPFLSAGISLLPTFRYDLILHLIEYAILAWLILRYLHVSDRIGHKLALLGTIIFCGIIGGLNELWQMHIPNRTVGIDDAIANIVGAVVIVWWIGRKRKT
ncbi:MAG: VanZ family protein [Candidatus Electryoneaceae bacterium]|nr:VanZ family protein [Candidatus Electryoneaceae bacterium]